MTHPRRFVWFWLGLVLVLIGLLVLALLHNPAAAQQDTQTDEAAITALVDAMTDAIRAQNCETYLNYVDLAGPVFRSEHTYWIDDWAEGAPLDRFALDVTGIAVSGDTATGTLTVIWARQPDVSYRRAEFPARFMRDSGGEWRFAGGAWQTLETEHFQVHIFPGMEPVAKDLIAMLPAIYDHATGSLGYVPDDVMHIKLYDHPDDLGALIALSLPQIRGWNEPGESLKLLVLPGETPSAAVMAHELTHFLTFEMAGTTHGQYPWWVMEGISEYVAAEYWDDAYAAERIEAVQYWAAAGRLAPWDEISDFETTPVDLWRYVYPQGYAFVRYVSAVFGEDARNAWLWAMAGERDIYAASESALEMPFEDLSAGFLGWLAEQ